MVVHAWKACGLSFFVIWHGTGKRRQKDRAHGGNEGWSLLLVVLREYYGRNVLK
jgi:hypothetical protein